MEEAEQIAHRRRRLNAAGRDIPRKVLLPRTRGNPKYAMIAFVQLTPICFRRSDTAPGEFHTPNALAIRERNEPGSGGKERVAFSLRMW